MKIVKIIILLLIVCSCTNSRNNIGENTIVQDSIVENDVDIKQAVRDFQEFIYSLPRIELPYSICCEDCCEHADFDYENNHIAKYLPEGSNPIGLVSKGNKFAVVLVTYSADRIVPSLVVYNLNGEIIDEKNFMTGWCGIDYDYLELQYLIINKDLKVCSIDTTYTFNRDITTKEIIDTINIEISKKDYKVNAEGQIIEK